MEKCLICELGIEEEVIQGVVANHHVYTMFDDKLEFQNGEMPTEVMYRDGWYYYTALDSTWWGEAECAKGIFLFSCRDKFGFASAKTGEIVIEPQFNKSTWMIPYPDENGESQACANVWKDGKTGFIDHTGREICPIEYEDAKEWPVVLGSQSYFAVKKNGKWGLVDRNCRTVLEFQYDELEGCRDIWGTGRKFILLCKWKDKYKCMKYGILSDFLEVTVPAVLDRHPEKIDIFGGNRSYFYLIRGHKWGAVDECGLVLREPKYTKREVDIWIEERSSTDIKEYARKQLSEPRGGGVTDG